MPADRLETERLRLEIARPGHEAALARFFAENFESHLARWSPPPPPGGHTLSWWAERLPGHAAEFERGESARWVVFLRESDSSNAVATANVTQIVRGPFQAAYLGYQVDRRHEGLGLMTEALRAVVTHAFDEMRLHRLMANHVPENERSIRVLARLGFAKEGLAKDYLFIGGAWRDHVLTALANPAFDPAWMETPAPNP
ncbi:MAG: GNAT family N-acetyltransferase [Betaproteobacteria bacterium]|nr:GNAT family N-acetyltransferase [Betaproteobacteria bacterium]